MCVTQGVKSDKAISMSEISEKNGAHTVLHNRGNEQSCKGVNQVLLFDVNGLDDKFSNTLGSKQLSHHIKQQAESECENLETGSPKVNLTLVLFR